MTKKEFFDKIQKSRLNGGVVIRKKEVMRRASSRQYPSLDTGYSGVCSSVKKEYTGDAMIGISSTHKSNDIPIFRKDHVKEITNMRR
jgi:hypothetical protein